MKDINVSAGIVLYNPNIEQLKKQVNEIINIVNKIYLVDNNSKNIKEIKKNFIYNNKIELILNNDNLGIATALNQIVKRSELDKIKWLLTLDQDSLATRKMISEMLKYTKMDNVSMISPRILDRNKDVKKISITNEYDYIERCITSGTIMNIMDAREIGYFDEKMFIDYVDFDYCKRLSINNKKIIRVNSSILEHEIGKRKKRKFFFKTVYPTNHNKNRIYYYVRNINYYLIKFKKNMSLKEKLIEYKYLLWKLTSIVLYEKNKYSKLKMYFKGKRDSKKII